MGERERERANKRNSRQNEQKRKISFTQPIPVLTNCQAVVARLLAPVVDRLRPHLLGDPEELLQVSDLLPGTLNEVVAVENQDLQIVNRYQSNGFLTVL